MSLTSLSKDIRFDNASKGFDPTEGGVGRYLLLAISEICEAQNEVRDGKGFQEIYYTGENKKPEGFPVELADAAIRILDIGAKFNIDFEALEPPNDLEGKSIDDWLLEIVSSISLAGSYEPEMSDFEIYLTEALATIFLLCERQKIPIMEVIQEKLAYNRTRPPKHGRKF